jgi:hypothetical protein
MSALMPDEYRSRHKAFVRNEGAKGAEADGKAPRLAKCGKPSGPGDAKNGAARLQRERNLRVKRSDP